ncbi:tyrosine--tRNA ligase [Candidatus Parcubacteria bacterium]|nr:tyrosine--tRNA ligase [Patescibacteria group bacterium]MBU4309432.1 tyrosine--tRNA ligase [Patescibacteria group bacterium]MBU4431914.1 tyrosine--tRNA ligase [Patescibacteria group bacterium]MBU4577793.1 tyrosine--tRNA ligase [Patescibacteria group bacterium]MCG2696786.1 tyrosine--tRNA ligase [Candidatus Parcubacteria bacterium]
MSKVTTDKEKIAELLDRGVEKIYPNREMLEAKLLRGEKIRLYGGFDPSAPSLHIGNAILINKLAQFQKMGHEVIFLIGDFTGMIGDPTDKTATRKKLTREEVLDNCHSYQKQAAAFLDFEGENAAQVKYNSEWLDKLTFRDLIEVSSHFTVQQMIQRDMFQKRIEEEKPIHLHEFLYPLAQGYDSVVMDVDLEIGGNDQMFNMMAGRDLMKSMGKKEKFVITLKLLADDKGKKMGKSEGNAVFLDTDANNVYGVIMSWPDGIVPVAFELCTNIDIKEVDEIANDMRGTEVNPRDYKMKLAHELTRIIHGAEAADQAQEHFIKTVQKKEIPDEIKHYVLKVDTMNIKSKFNVVNLLHETSLVASKSDARRMIEQGAVKVDGEVINDVDKEVEIGDEGVLLQKGKRGFVRVIKK